MFRRLYWITEQTDPNGVFRATGVYTSIHDLVERGLRWIEPSGVGFRISLVKLDCRSDVLGSWVGPQFEGVADGLQPYVDTHEFTIEECLGLQAALETFMSAPAN